MSAPAARFPLRRRDRTLSRTGIVVVALLLAAGAAVASPQRIVSINVCADQLLLMLADRTRIVSLSHLSADPHTSAMTEEAAGFPLNHGLLEEILPLEPDLVLSGAYTLRPTVFALRRLGYRVAELPVAVTFADIRDNIRKVADEIGSPERGKDLIAKFDRELADAAAPASDPLPLAAIYAANNYSSGQGTLVDAVVRQAGWRNLAAELGARGTTRLPLETLLISDPDLLIIGHRRDGAALAYETLRHPALRQAFSRRATVSIPDSLWVCGTPVVAEAVGRLRAVRLRLAGKDEDRP